MNNCKKKIIESCALSECRLLKEITISASVETIGNCAFDYCTSLMTAKFLSTSLNKNESCLFCGCTSIKEF